MTRIPMTRNPVTRITAARLLVAAGLLCGGCRQDMHDQPRLDAFEASAFFPDGRSARPQVPGTVARGELNADVHLYTGKVDGEPATTFPFAVTREVLERGRGRFTIFCSACHGPAGYGDGIVPQRGFRNPPSLHVDRLRDSPPGHFFEVITNGFGAMFDFADRVAPRDRWAIAAYIRVLQESQNARLDDLTAEEREGLQAKER